MNELLSHIKSLKEIYSILILLISLGGTTYQGYNNIINDISKNTTAVETTQITMLKVIVRDFENKHICRTSDQTWEEYILNYSTLFDLKVKYKMISEKAQWQPIERKLIKCEVE